MRTGKLVHDSFLAAALACVPLAGVTVGADAGTDGPWRATKQSTDHSVEQIESVSSEDRGRLSKSVIRTPNGGTAVDPGIRQVQFRQDETRRNEAAPGVTAGGQGSAARPSPNHSVVSELNRLFQENGQQMPSMRPEDLPNANVHRPQIARQPAESAELSAEPQSGQQTRSQTAAPRKQNIFQKFVGRLRGRGAQTADSAAAPSQSGDAPPNSLSDRSAPAPGQSRPQARKPALVHIQPPARVPPADPPQVAAEGRKTPTASQPAAGRGGKPVSQPGPATAIGQTPPSGRSPMAESRAAASRSSERSASNATHATAGQSRNQKSASVRSASRPQTAAPGAVTSAPDGGRRPEVSKADRHNAVSAQNKSAALRTQSTPQKSAVTAVPPVQRPQKAETAQNAAPGSSGTAGTPTRDFVQPGTAPAFMPSAVRPSTVRASPVAPNEEAALNSGTPAAVAGRRTLQSAATAGAAAAAAAPKVSIAREDDFVDPFEEKIVPGTPDEYLDLDSLIEAPDSLQAPAAADLNQTADSAGEAQAAPVAPAELPSAEELPEPEPVPGVPANPFTGVRLNPAAESRGTEGAVTGNGAAAGNPGGTGAEWPVGDGEEEDLDADDYETGDPGPAIQRDRNSLPGVGGRSSEFPAEEAAGDLLPAVEDFPEHQVAVPRAAVKATLAGLRRSPGGTTVPETDEELPVLAPVPIPSASVTAPAGLADTQTAAALQRDLQQKLIAARTGQTGLKGFCPVALRDQRKLVDSNPEIRATFGLQQYTLSSAEARSTFESDPARYAPAAGGSDVVLLVTSGEEEAGLLDYSVWYRDRLYLFRSRETMTMFNLDPAAYADQY